MGLFVFKAVCVPYASSPELDRERERELLLLPPQLFDSGVRSDKISFPLWLLGAGSYRSSSGRGEEQAPGMWHFSRPNYWHWLSSIHLTNSPIFYVLAIPVRAFHDIGAPKMFPSWLHEIRWSTDLEGLKLRNILSSTSSLLYIGHVKEKKMDDQLSCRIRYICIDWYVYQVPSRDMHSEFRMAAKNQSLGLWIANLSNPGSLAATCLQWGALSLQSCTRYPRKNVISDKLCVLNAPCRPECCKVLVFFLLYCYSMAFVYFLWYCTDKGYLVCSMVLPVARLKRLHPLIWFKQISPTTTERVKQTCQST